MRKKSILQISFILCLAVSACGKSKPDVPETTSAVAAPSGPKVTCPVCGLTFSQSDAVGSINLHGKKYFFYLSDHMNAFKADPEAFISSDTADAKTDP